jgi:hypothetical protein
MSEWLIFGAEQSNTLFLVTLDPFQGGGRIGMTAKWLEELHTWYYI